MLEIEREIRTGETRQVGDLEITPQSQVLKILSPGRHFGLIWNRPKAIIVTGLDGTETILPIRDVTRNILWGLLAGGLVGAILIGMMHRMNNMGNTKKE
jgi:hypothetical protein